MDREVGRAIGRGGGRGRSPPIGIPSRGHGLGRGRGRSPAIPIPSRGHGGGESSANVIDISSSDESGELISSTAGDNKPGAVVVGGPIKPGLISPAPNVIDISSSDEADDEMMSATAGDNKPRAVVVGGDVEATISETGGPIKPGLISPARMISSAVGDSETDLKTASGLLPAPGPTLATLASVSVPYKTPPLYVGDGTFFFHLEDDEPLDGTSIIAPTMVIILGAYDANVDGAGKVRLANTGRATIFFPQGGASYVGAGGELWYKMDGEPLKKVVFPMSCEVIIPEGGCVNFGSVIQEFEGLGISEADDEMNRVA